MKSVNLLLVEDDGDYARLLQYILDGAGPPAIQVTHVRRLVQALAQLTEGGADVVVLDLSLPDAQGPETLCRLHAAARHVPVIVLTGLDDDQLGVELVRGGAQDYLVKGQETALLVRAVRHAIERERVLEGLRAQVHQQAAVAALAERALRTRDISALLDEAATLVSRTLGVDYVTLLEFRPDQRDFSVRAGAGWQPELGGPATVAATLDSQAGRVLQSREPVIIEDLPGDPHFAGSPLLRDHGVVGSLRVLILAPEWADATPWGVLEAHTTSRRRFTQEDVNFVQSAVNVLAAAIEGSLREVRDLPG